jgi:ribosomal protein S18 acetylase RimI-like enzyme
MSSSRATRRARLQIRAAGLRDVPALLAMMVAFNAHEGIAHRPRRLEAALRKLLRDRSLGLVLIARDPASRTAVGYTVVTYNYDLEFAGPDAFVTELFVAPEQRKRGVARTLLRAVVRQMKAEDMTALLLVVRPENRVARKLYASLGFALVPRVMMTKVLVR